LLLLLYVLTTSLCCKTGKYLTADEDDDDDEIFVDTAEKQPLITDNHSIRQYTTDQQQTSQWPVADSTKTKLAGDI